MLCRFALPFGLIIFALPLGPVAHAANDVWDNIPGGNWENGANWIDNSTPGAGDTATFNLLATYPVTFGVAPTAIQSLTVNAGTVTFQSSGGAKSLVVNSGGTQDVLVTGATTTLNLGTPGNPLSLTAGDDLSVQSGATLEARFGSDVVANDLSTSGLNGTLRIDGSGSTLTINSSAQHLIANSGAGSLQFQNSSTGNSITGGLRIADNASGVTGSVSITGGSSVTMDGSLALASQNVVSQDGTLTINGTSSILSQSGVTTITVGSATNGTAAINIGTTATGGTLTTGTGLFTINATGSVTIGSGANTGTLNANGNITINGGELIRGSNSTFTLASSRTMTIENGGAARFTGSYTTAANAIYNINGAGSTLETTSIGNTLSIVTGTVVTASSQGTVSAGGSMSISNGTLVVDGAGSSADAGSSSQWATGGTTADVTFSNGASGSFPSGVSVATSAAANTTADVSILSGADLTSGSMSLATSGGATTSATLTVDGAGSTLSPGTSFNIGHGSTGTAVVNVLNDGSLTVGAGGTTTLNTTGTINIDGGIADLKTLTDNGGTINFTAGSLSYLGNLTVGSGGLLGGNLTLASNHQLTLNGTTTVDAGRTLTLNGGTLNTGSLVVNGTLAFNAGTLGITGSLGLTIGGGGPFGSTLTLGAGQTLNVTNTTLVNAGSLVVVENGGTLSSELVNNSGEIALDGASANLQSLLVNNFGLLRGRGRIDAPLINQVSGGEVRVATGELLQFIDPGSSLNGGRINLLGGTLEFTQSALTNNSAGQIIGNGSLIADSILNEGTMAFSGPTNVLGDVINDEGVIISSGGGPTTFFDDVVNDGEIRTSSGSFSVFFGAVSGSGTFTGLGTVNMEGDLSPGSSPATVSFGGDVVFGSGASLAIELGGTMPGSEYDQLDVNGEASLDGTLIVSLPGGYEPSIGDTFEIITAAGGLDGTFTVEDLPELTGLLWEVEYDYDADKVMLLTLPEFSADFDLDRDVDGDDLAQWEGDYGVNGLSDADGDGDSDGIDFLAWQQQFGSGVEPLAVAAAVPEPSVLSSLLMIAIAGTMRRKRRR